MRIIKIWFLLFPGLLSMEMVHAQGVVNDNALITITPGTRMTVQGAVLNNGDVVNHGTLSISGDWMNVDTYDPQTGLFVLDGNGTQRIAHNGQQIYQLRIAGGGEKVLSSDLSVQDTLDLRNGLVTPEPGVSLLVRSGGVAYGGSPQSHINGVLYHEGTGWKRFPLGKNGNFRPMELTNVSGTNPVVGFEIFEPHNSPQIPFTLQTVSLTRYYQMTVRSGTFDGSLIRLKVGPDENLGNVEDLQDLVVTSSDQLGSIFFSLGQSQFTGTLTDGETTSALPATQQYYALGIEGLVEERTLYIPNALSPAAPNPEDRVVKVYGEQIVDEDFMFRIYDRWGKLVYETDSFVEANTIGWAGVASSGKEQILGVYHFTLVGKFISGNRFQRNGSITLIK